MGQLYGRSGQDRAWLGDGASNLLEPMLEAKDSVEVTIDTTLAERQAFEALKAEDPGLDQHSTAAMNRAGAFKTALSFNVRTDWLLDELKTTWRNMLSRAMELHETLWQPTPACSRRSGLCCGTRVCTIFPSGLQIAGRDLVRQALVTVVPLLLSTVFHRQSSFIDTKG